MASHWRFCWAVGLVLWCVSCQAREAELLSLEGIEPTALEPEARIAVLGSGFAAGRSCTIHFDGSTRRPGARPVAASLKVAGHAETDERVSAILDRDAFSALGGHGTFEGELTLFFEAKKGGRVLGRQRVALDLIAPMADGPAAREQRRRDAEALLSSLGLAIADDGTAQQGARVEWAAEASRAARSGLAQGDVIVRAAGVSVHMLGDLAPPPGAREIELWVEHSDGTARAHVLSLDGHVGSSFGDGAVLRLGALATGLLLCLIFLSPLPSPARWLAVAGSDLCARRASSLRVWGGDRQRHRSRGPSLSWALCVSAWGMLALYFDPAGLSRLGAPTLCLGAVGVALGTRALGHEARHRSLLATLGSTLLSGAIVVLVVTCACALRGTHALRELMAQQGAAPYRWAALQSPAVFVGLPLYLAHAARLADAEMPGSLARVATNVALASLAAAAFLGGTAWPAALAFGGVPSALWGAAAFVAKVWAFGYAMHLARQSALRNRLGLLRSLVASLVVVSLTLLALWLPPSPAFSTATGVVLSAVSAVVLLARLGAPARKLGDASHAG